jgi:2-polyprenyl-3-methyl-5-hydroxy-6-metoxy-1,4-benzoquinol methylase
MLDQRATEAELLDRRDIGAQDTVQSGRVCAMVNRFGGGTTVVRKFVQAELTRVTTDRPLRVLDIGAGDASIALAVSRWARGQGRNVEWVCLERSPHAAGLARHAVAAAKDSRIQVIEDDIRDHRPDEPYDCAIGSMFFHHLADDEIVAMLERLRTFVRRSVLVNDLKRCPVCYFGYAAISLLFSPAIRHDALLSIRRGFKTWELRRLLSRTKNVSVSVTRHWFCRLVGVIRFD